MRLTTRVSLALVACVCLTAQPVAAQRVDDLRAGLGSVTPVKTSPDYSAIAASVRESHWKEGALVGAVAGGITATVLLAFYAENRGSWLEFGGFVLSSAAIIGGVGALIGGQFPKGGGKDDESGFLSHEKRWRPSGRSHSSSRPEAALLP